MGHNFGHSELQPERPNPESRKTPTPVPVKLEATSQRAIFFLRPATQLSGLELAAPPALTQPEASNDQAAVLIKDRHRPIGMLPGAKVANQMVVSFLDLAWAARDAFESKVQG